MIPRHILTFLLPLLLLPAAVAEAATRGLFLLGSITQQLTLDYNYSGQDSKIQGGGGGASENQFDERYGITMSYGLLDPRIYNGHIGASIRLDQTLYSGPSSTRTSGVGLLYNLDGVFFDRKPVPFYYSVRSDSSHIARPFTGGYDATTDSYLLGMEVRNRILPIRAEFTENITQTSGLAIDTLLRTDTYRLTGSQKLSYSDTDFSMTHTRSHYEAITGVLASDDSQLDINFSNRLTLPGDGRNLSTSLTYMADSSSNQTVSNLSVTEALAWQLGKALSMSADYGGGFSRFSSGPAAPEIDTSTHSGGISLSHRLYKSLLTRLYARVRVEDGSNGRTNQYGGGGVLSYDKTLSPGSSLQLSYADSYQVTDQNLTSQNVQIVNEPVTADVTRRVQLRNFNVLPASIVVRDADNPIIQFAEGTDYLVVQIGTATFLDFSPALSTIPDGKKLLVTYTYQVNPSITYGANSRSANGTLSLANGVYQVSAGFSQTLYNLISGSTSSFQLANSLQYTAVASRNKDGVFLSVMYLRNDSGLDSYQYAEATYRGTYMRGRNTFTLGLRDRITSYDATPLRSSRTENQVTATASAARNLASYGTVSLNTGYTHFSTRSNESDDVLAEVIYRWGRGKLFLDVSGRTHWRMSDTENMREDRVSVRVTRYF